jgi:hypothetical protein
MAQVGEHPAANCPFWPLIHRTGRAAHVLHEGILKRGPAGTQLERDAGLSETVYAFVGAGAYPKGLVALFLDPAVTTQLQCTFTPFDSGGLEADKFEGGDSHAQVFDQWHGQGAWLAEAAAAWIGACFDEPESYVRRLEGPPDHPAPHGLISREGDRRAWTLEVQLHEDVPVSDWLRRLVVAHRASLFDVPEAWVDCAEVVEAEGDVVTEADFARHLISAILVA